MLKRIGLLFSTATELNSEEFEEFELSRKALNVERCVSICKILIVLNITLISIDETYFKSMRIAAPEYIYLYYSHIVVAVLAVIWLIALHLMKGCSQRPKYTLIYHVMANVVIYWGVFMGVIGLKINGQIMAYLICILSLSLVLYLSPLEAMLMYFISVINFSICISLFPMSQKIFYTRMIDASIAAVCSFIAASISYTHFKKDFANKKNILKKQSELQASNLRLNEYEKLRTDYFANVSHELRTPLNIIYGSEQMIENKLQEKNLDTKNISKYLKMIKQNSLRLMKLVNNLIDMTKIEATMYEIKPINCDIVSLVENITMSAAGYIENKGISLIFDTDFEEKEISCDPEKIERIVLNLLSNAVKFTNSNGSIYVNIFMENDRVNISVRDTGIGIPEDMKELIFERFVQVDKTIDRNREGSGIGLSLVKSLVEMQEGNISVKSELGQGSEFIISLPDRRTGEHIGEEYLNCLEGQRIERINIEFSDVFD